MSTVIIIGGGGNRITMHTSTGYPVSAGDAVENEATSGPASYVIFTNNAMQTTDIYLNPGQKVSFTEAGAAALQP